jgi:hypothetical protein
MRIWFNATAFVELRRDPSQRTVYTYDSDFDYANFKNKPTQCHQPTSYLALLILLYTPTSPTDSSCVMTNHKSRDGTLLFV